MLVSSESFLQEFHRQFPSCTSEAFSRGFDEGGRTTYGVLVEALKGERGPILDLACGDGYLLERFAESRESNADLFGIDMSEGELEVAWRSKVLRPAQILKGNARELPFAPAVFGAVSCHMAFMLMPRVDEVVREIHRVLKPGGAFAMILPGERKKDAPEQAYRDWLWANLPKEKHGALDDLGDGRTKSKSGLESLFAEFGDFNLEPIETAYDLTPEELTHSFLTLYPSGLLGDELIAKGSRDLLATFRSWGREKIRHVYQVWRVQARKSV